MLFALNETGLLNAAPRVAEAGCLNTLLVVDDCDVDRRIATRLAQKVGGLRVVGASDGREALEIIGREAPSAILTDLQMPDMDGLELVQEIRERDLGIPVILMTAYGSEEVAMRALRAGATNYVPKKALAAELAATLKAVLSVASASRTRRRLCEAMEEREVRLRIENDPALLAPLIELLQEDLARMDLADTTTRMRVGVALQEALSNALFHGNLEVNSDLRQVDERRYYELAERRRKEEPYRSRRVLVHARLTAEAATYVIRDEGPGFDVSTLERPFDPEDLVRIGGRGMLLIRTFMDEVVHNPSGNQITMIKRR